MSITKSSILKIFFAVVALIFLFAPVDFLIKFLMTVLTIFTHMLELIASKKGMPLTLLHFLWSNFLGPLFRLLVLATGFIALVPVETIAVWGLPIYLAILPVTVLILKRWVTSFCATFKFAELLKG